MGRAGDLLPSSLLSVQEEGPFFLLRRLSQPSLEGMGHGSV